MRITAGGTVVVTLAIFGPTTGGLAAPDSTPTALVKVGGTTDGAVTPTVTLLSTGKYKVQFAVPVGYNVDQVVELQADWTIGGAPGFREWVFIVDVPIASRSTFAGGSVTVGAYAAGQSPADLVLATPANKLATTGGGLVGVGSMDVGAINSIWNALTSGMTTAGSVGKRIADFVTGADTSGVTTLLGRLTSTRAIYLDALTALTEGRMTWLDRLGTAMEETSTGSGIWRWTTLALSRVGLDITAIRGKTDALPADPASETTVNSRLSTAGYTAPDNAGIGNALTQATNAAASALSADGKLTTQRLTNLDAATPTRLGILDRLASMMEQVSGLWRWTSNTQSQAPVTDANTVAAAVVAQALIKNMAGLTGANQVCRDFTYDGSGNLTQFRIRVYDSAGNAQTDNGATGLVASYLVTNTLNVSGQITKTTTKLE